MAGTKTVVVGTMTVAREMDVEMIVAAAKVMAGAMIVIMEDGSNNTNTNAVY